MVFMQKHTPKTTYIQYFSDELKFAALKFGHLLDFISNPLVDKDFCIILYLVKQLDMGYPTKIQVIKRKASEQWYVNFPAAVAQAIEFNQGEIVEWIIDDHQRLVLMRSDESVKELKKKLPQKT
jgi:antitoxin component of MazEF toxin-antitoxin module